MKGPVLMWRFVLTERLGTKGKNKRLSSGYLSDSGHRTNPWGGKISFSRIRYTQVPTLNPPYSPGVEILPLMNKVRLVYFAETLLLPFAKALNT